MLGKILENVKKAKPLVHCITNYVTVNDVANCILACGGSPIMADEEQEVAEITSACSALYLNIGTLNERTLKSMIIAGRKANELNIPILLDPVGVGVSSFRKNAVETLLSQVHFSVIKGNYSEIKSIFDGKSSGRGVDCDCGQTDGFNHESFVSMANTTQKLAKKYHCIIVATDKVDIISDENVTYLVGNGDPFMTKITGAGCMLGGVMSAYIGIGGNMTENVLASTCLMGMAGYGAKSELKRNDGIGTFRNKLIDHLYLIDKSDIEEYANYEQLD